MRYVANLVRWAASLASACSVAWLFAALVDPGFLNVRNWPAILRWFMEIGGVVWIVTAPLLALVDRDRVAFRARPFVAFIVGAISGAALLGGAAVLGLGFTQGGLPKGLYAGCALVGGLAVLFYYSRLVGRPALPPVGNSPLDSKAE